MSFKEPIVPLRDIIESIAMIQQFTMGMDFAAFCEDPKTVAAVERKLLLIAEAAVRLGREAPFIVPEIPWRNIRGMGNWLRHQYDRVDLQTVWNTVTDDLPALKTSVLEAIKQS